MIKSVCLIIRKEKKMFALYEKKKQLIAKECLARDDAEKK